MERLPEDVVKRLKDMANRIEGVGARAIINYINYEFEVGGPAKEVLQEAEEMARREMEELKALIEVVNELRNLIA